MILLRMAMYMFASMWGESKSFLVLDVKYSEYLVVVSNTSKQRWTESLVSYLFASILTKS